MRQPAAKERHTMLRQATNGPRAPLLGKLRPPFLAKGVSMNGEQALRRAQGERDSSLKLSRTAQRAVPYRIRLTDSGR